MNSNRNLRYVRNIIRLSFAYILATTICFAESDIARASVEHDSIMYLLNDNPAQIVRYDLESEQFLDEINLISNPLSIAVDDTGIYVGTIDKKITYFDLSGNNESELATLDIELSDLDFELTVNDNFLFALSRNPFDSGGNFKLIFTLDKSDGSIVSTKEFRFPSTGVYEISATDDYLIASSGSIPYKMELLASGELGEPVFNQGNSIRGLRTGNNRLTLLSELSMAVDGAGNAYSLPGLDYVGPFASNVDDIAINNQNYFILNDRALTLHDQDLLRNGIYKFQNLVHTIAISNSNVVGFYYDSDGNAGVESISINNIEEPPLSPLPSPGLIFNDQPTAAWPMSNDTILVYFGATKLYQYSIATQSLTGLYTLPEQPLAMLFHQENDSLYISYRYGRVAILNLEQGVETTFANLADSALALLPIGENVLAMDKTGNDTFTVYSPTGQKLSEKSGNELDGLSTPDFFVATGYVWSPLNEKLFHANTLTNRIYSLEIGSDGIIGANDASPYQDFDDRFTFKNQSLQLSNDESSLLLSSGEIISTSDFELLHLLGESEDYIFVSNPLWTTDGGVVGLQYYDDFTLALSRWDNGYQQVKRLPRFETTFQLLRVDTDVYLMGTRLVLDENNITRNTFTIFKIHENDDTDGDSFDNLTDVYPVNPYETSDYDNDGVGDNTDLDDDNDGVSDSEDAFPFDASETIDSDGDGIGNNSDPDNDNDGVNDTEDAFPFNSEETLDTDGDSVGDNADNDDDGDGYADINDAFPLDVSEDKDENNNGIGDYSEATLIDTDDDGIPNNIDFDDDNDRVYDADDAFPLDETEYNDRDGDGIGDNTDSTPNGETLDSEQLSPVEIIVPSVQTPTLENAAELAIDGNPTTSWTSDLEGSFTIQIELGGSFYIDRIVLSWGDNLPADYVFFLSDENNSFFTRLYLESDTDGGTDIIEIPELKEGSRLYLFTSSSDVPYQLSITEIEIYGRIGSQDLDTDDDGRFDANDSDDDNDGTDDDKDDLPLDPSETTDTDSDGIGNNIDQDDDNDGVADSADAFPLDASRSIDTDGDRIDDSIDPDAETAYGLWQGQIQVNPGLGGGGTPEISMAGDGTAFAIWQFTDSSTTEWRDRIYTSQYDGLGTWSQPTLLDDLPYQGLRNVRIAADSGGNAVAIWSRSLPDVEQYYLAYSEYKPATGWTELQAATESQAADYIYPFIDIEFSETDEALFVWATLTPDSFDRTFQLNSKEYSSALGLSDEIQVIAITPFPSNTSDGVQVTNLDMNQSGQAVLGFSLYRYSGAERSSWISFYDKSNGWSEVEKFADARVLSNVAIDNAGNVMALHLGYVNLGTGRFVDSYFVQQYNESDGWSDELRVLSQEYYGISRPRLAYGDSGHAVIAWHESRGFLNQFIRGMYLRPGQGWTQPQKLIGDSFRWGEFSDLAIDNLGNAIVVFHASNLDYDSNIYANRITPESDWLGAELLYDLNAQGGTDCCPINIEIDGLGNAIAAWTHAGIRANYFKAGERDFDQDGVPNDVDTDDDNDGVNDIDDAFPLDANESQDTDQDGVGNNADNDDDNDGALDTEDAFPLDANESQDNDGDGSGDNADVDDDNDGVNDVDDAFPLDANESQDTDQDGIGNNADNDDDNDGVNDDSDAFPLNVNENSDNDGDGTGDNADTDDDNDGVNDVNDAFPFDDSEDTDTDGDGTGNNADEDDDNDGMPDEWELRNGLNPVDAGDANQDRDGDGIDNVTEYENSLNPPELPEQGGGGSTQWPMLLFLLISIQWVRRHNFYAGN